MKDRHLDLRINQLLELSRASKCSRRKFAAMIIDPLDNVLISDGYNGGPRSDHRSRDPGSPDLCGGDYCKRTRLGLSSGARVEIGCHHSEMNAITNAARRGAATRGAWIIVTGEPCLMCAKLIHHAGIERVVCVKGGYLGAGDGVGYLEFVGVEVVYRDGPQDPRATPEASPGASRSTR